MSIRLERFPNELQGMLRHEEIVQDMQGQGKDGLSYDAKFRRLKEQHPFIKYGEYLAEIVNGLPPLINRLPTGNVPTRFRPPVSQPRLSLPGQRNYMGKPNGVCYRFNSWAGCQIRQCLYRHACKKCGKPGHSIMICNEGYRN